MSIRTLLLFAASLPAIALEPGEPSKTSIWTAISRAIGAKNPDPQFRNPDYLAAKFIGPRERALLPDYPVEALDADFDAALMQLPAPAHVTGMFVRTKHMDLTLEHALSDGIRQVVILGAGFDSRGYRYQQRLSGVRFFEVDYGPTQEWKKRRVSEILGQTPKHVRYVPMDFTRDDLLSKLTAQGYRPNGRTLFIWEGVVYYIPESAVVQTLTFVRDHSAPGSRIVFDYPLSSFPDINNPESRTAKWGEPMIFGFPGDSASELVRRVGLEIISDEKWSDLAQRYATRADGTLALPAPRGGVRGGLRYCHARVADRR